jgi:hypothetical protein
MRSIRTRRPLKPLALALAIAALAVPTAQAKSTPAGTYGPLDPAIAAAIRSHQSAQSVPLITEHTAGQNGTGQASAAGKHGTLDPAIAAAIRNRQHGQNGVSRSAAVSTPVAGANGFDWSAAGIGATVAFAAMLLGFGAARVIPRRSRARLA